MFETVHLSSNPLSLLEITCSGPLRSHFTLDSKPVQIIGNTALVHKSYLQGHLARGSEDQKHCTCKVTFAYIRGQPTKMFTQLSEATSPPYQRHLLKCLSSLLNLLLRISAASPPPGSRRTNTRFLALAKLLEEAVLCVTAF